MTLLHAFQRGWLAAWRSKIALLLMWLTYALIAKIVAIPAVVLLLDPLSHSRMAGRLLERFDAGWLGDLIDTAGTSLLALSGAMAVAGVLTWLVAILFAGGVLTMLDEHWERFSFALFCSGAGEHFWRILRLSLFGLLCYGLAWGLGRIPSVVAKKIYGHGMEEWPIGVASIIGSVLTVLLLGWVATVLDYAKVRLVSSRRYGSFKALMRSFVFVFLHFPTTMGVWLMNAILFGLLGAIYLKLSTAIEGGALWAIALLIATQQAFILFRTAQRIAVWGSAIVIYDALVPSPPPPFEAVFEPALSPGVPPEPAVQAEATPKREE